MRVLFYVFIFFLKIACGERWQNEVSLKKTGWKYLMKFCGRTMDNINEPAVFFEVELNSEEPITSEFHIAMYLDREDSWGEQSKIKDKCKNDGWKVGMIGGGHPVSLMDKTENKIELHADETQRPHFWYFALVNCDKPSTKVDYTVHAWQSHERWWSAEFSFNDRGLNTLYLVFAILYPILLLAHFHSWKLHSILGAHHIVRLISICIATELIGIVLTFISYLHFAKHGRMQMVCFVLGGLLMITSSTIFLFVLFLLAQGWIISTDEKPAYVNEMTIGCGAIGTLHCLFFFWRDLSGHSDSNLYFYDSPPQSIYALSFAFLGFLFAGFCHQSWMAEKNDLKQVLYMRLGFIYIFYFFVPLASMILANALSPWVRDITIRATYEVSHFLFLAVVVFLLHPQVNVLEISYEEKQHLTGFNLEQESYL